MTLFCITKIIFFLSLLLNAANATMIITLPKKIKFTHNVTSTLLSLTPITTRHTIQHYYNVCTLYLIVAVAPRTHKISQQLNRFDQTTIN